MIISKKFHFDSAHYIPNYEGKCKNMHGHNWTIELACSGRVGNGTGMVYDFSELKKFCDVFEERYDHKCLNDLIPNPTAECICEDIYKEFNLWCVARGLKFEYIRVWETEDSMAERNSRG